MAMFKEYECCVCQETSIACTIHQANKSKPIIGEDKDPIIHAVCIECVMQMRASPNFEYMACPLCRKTLSAENSTDTWHSPPRRQHHRLYCEEEGAHPLEIRINIHPLTMAAILNQSEPDLIFEGMMALEENIESIDLQLKQPFTVPNGTRYEFMRTVDQMTFAMMMEDDIARDYDYMKYSGATGLYYMYKKVENNMDVPE